MGKGKDAAGSCVACGACAFICILILVILGLGGLGIAKIVLGAIHLHDCSIERLIPIFLIVSGVSPILFGGLGKKKSDDNSEQVTSGQICGFIGGLFNLAWLICGSIWVYPNYGKLKDVNFVQCTTNITTTACANVTCNETLIKFAFAMVTLDWIFMGFFIVLIGCTISAACCRK